MKQGNEAKQAAAFQTYTLSSLSEEQRTPPPFIVEGLIPVGLSFLAGAPKSRKSFLALQLASSVGAGVPFLGFRTNPCSVLYLDLEGSPSRTSQRAERMRIPVPDSVSIAHRIPHRLTDKPSLVDDIQALHHQQPDVGLVIIDTLSRAKGAIKSGGQSAYDLDVMILEPIQRMALDERIAILFVHHYRKGSGMNSDPFERVNGTTGIVGSADSVLNLTLEGRREDGRAVLEYTPRDARGGQLRLSFDEVFGEWVLQTERAGEDNPILRWVIQNCPPRLREAEFHAYTDVFQDATGRFSENAGAKVREALEPFVEELFEKHGIAIQLGVLSHNRRGVRLFNVQ
jgi:hypothetical protein